MRHFLLIGIAAAAVASVNHQHATASDRLQLQVSPAVGMAPALVTVRAIVEHDVDNRSLELVADSDSFFRRSVVDLDGEHAPKINELKLIDIPGGDYEVSAILYNVRGERTIVKRNLTVIPLGPR